MSDLRATILNAQDTQAEQVEIPEWGVTVEVRGMTGKQRSEFMAACIDKKGNPQFSRIYSQIVIACTYGDDGEQVFEATDRDMLDTKSAIATQRIAKVAIRLSGMDEDAEDESGND